MSDESFNGWLEGWSARRLARGTTPGPHKGYKRPPAPLYKSAWTCGLRQRGFACSRAITFWPGRPSQLHGNWFVGWPRLLEDTGAGGLTPSVLVLTPTIRTHCLRGWDGAGGLISSLAVLTPTILTHYVRRWGQRPELLGHQVWPRRPGRWHRAERPALWTPTGWVTIE